jgi:hypothetical protein
MRYVKFHGGVPRMDERLRFVVGLMESEKMAVPCRELRLTR